ncbi:hypothetical protein GPECTOR_100g3 [Gonium pectorale]|uniref:SRCR domain-containing protein n=1 Tax=Gonium pectorale TaxID=33097 RepID=A0A150G1I3_GONPE|nr:hypothetical protein GPECTOR_100g3 [Gonium pectorale]|eukprot:KXZ43150.1 hypothetical protein GPECTOR_100g3 [Gonium pectorale]
MIIRVAPPADDDATESASGPESPDRAISAPPSAGRLEAYNTASRRWVPLCAGPWWTDRTATVACRQLGYASGKAVAEEHDARSGGARRRQKSALESVGKALLPTGGGAAGCEGSEELLWHCADVVDAVSKQLREESQGGTAAGRGGRCSHIARVACVA